MPGRRGTLATAPTGPHGNHAPPTRRGSGPPPTTDGQPGKFSRRYRVTWATDGSIAEVTEGRKVEPGSGEEALDEAGLVMYAPQPVLTRLRGQGDGARASPVAAPRQPWLISISIVPQ